MLRRVVGFAVHAFTLQNRLVENTVGSKTLYLNPISQILFLRSGLWSQFFVAFYASWN